MSRYLEHLPAVFQHDGFLGRFLLGFERILTGRMGSPSGLDSIPQGFEELLDHIHRYFDPIGDDASGANSAQSGTPDEFLPWLAGWVSTSLRDDWSAAKRRTFIQKATNLYRVRGTASGLAEMVSLYTDCPVAVLEPSAEDGGAPHYFKVIVSVMSETLSLEKIEDMARNIIDREKPAHTWYGLVIETPAFVFQIVNEVDAATQGLVVGRSTVLGVAQATFGSADSSGKNQESSGVVGMRIRNNPDAFNPGLTVGRNTRVASKE